MENVIEVNNLEIGIFKKDACYTVVDNLSFSIKEGETLGIVGESGCGKTMTALSIMKLLPDNIQITSGSVCFMGSDLNKKSGKEIRKICGKDIGMVFQEPMTSLNPLLTIEEQIGESLKYHLGYNKKQRREKIINLLKQVGITYPEKRLHQYPYEFSGGMRQRVMIAMALACNPKLIIADEPTTALDVTVQAQIIRLIRNLKKQYRNSLLLITHNWGVVAELADGVEMGPLQDMESADVVIIVTEAVNIMRILQGYAYKFGYPKHLRTIGNQAACSDLTAKPYFNNDLNISLMCEGARKYMKCSSGEMGVSMPINQFDDVVEGIVMTVNPVANKKEKDELLSRLHSEEELGIVIDKDTDYGKCLKEYDDFVQRIKYEQEQ